MKIVVDANIVISAAIIAGRTREVILLADTTFLAPPELEEEVRSYSSLVAEKSGLTEPEVQEILELLFASIGTVPYSLPSAALWKARKAIGDTDPDDVPYLATAITIGELRPKSSLGASCFGVRTFIVPKDDKAVPDSTGVLPRWDDSAYPVPICSTGIPERASSDAEILFKSRAHIRVGHVACLVVGEDGNSFKTVGLHPRGQVKRNLRFLGSSNSKSCATPRFSSSVFYRAVIWSDDDVFDEQHYVRWYTTQRILDLYDDGVLDAKDTS